MKESDISKSITKLLDVYEKKGLLTYTRTNSGMVSVSVPRGPGKVPGKRVVMLCRAGFPDISVILTGGIFLGLEVKTDIGRQNSNQKAMQEKFKGLGIMYEVVRSVKETKDILDWYFGENKK